METQSRFSSIRRHGNARALPQVTRKLQRKEDVMDREEVNWLLQTIKDPRDAKRFLLAQYERGRISLQLMNDVAPERDGIDRTTTPLVTTTRERWTEHSAMALVLAFAW